MIVVNLIFRRVNSTMFLLRFILYLIVSCIFLNSSFSHEMGEFEKYEKETFAVTTNEYIDYLRGDDLSNKEALSCLKIKVDYINYTNDLISASGSSVFATYYYQEDALVMNNIFYDGTEEDFKEDIKDIPKLLEDANNERGSLSEESIYIGLITRLFSNYSFSFGSHYKEYDLTKFRKCKDYKGRDHN